MKYIERTYEVHPPGSFVTGTKPGSERLPSLFPVIASRMFFSEHEFATNLADKPAHVCSFERDFEKTCTSR
jgi:hypothetical protein